MKRSKQNKAADTIIKSVLDELKSDPLEPSQRTDLYAVEKSSTAPDSSGEPTLVAVTKTGEENTEATQASESVVDSGKTTVSEEPTNAGTSSSISFADKTQPMYRPYSPSVTENTAKISHGVGRLQSRTSPASSGGQPELQLLQAENLKLAQTRILELEKELERLRQENELLFSAGEISRKQSEEYIEKLNLMERVRTEAQQQWELELNIFKESLQERERDLKKSKVRIQELESRLSTDLKKIRVRERELENRLELARMEKTTLLRSKDENILELKRKIDVIQSELEQHKQRNSELTEKLEHGHDQMSRTVRALRLALANLDANSEVASTTPVLVKKAE